MYPIYFSYNEFCFFFSYLVSYYVNFRVHTHKLYVFLTYTHTLEKSIMGVRSFDWIILFSICLITLFNDKLQNILCFLSALIAFRYDMRNTLIRIINEHSKRIESFYDPEWVIRRNGYAKSLHAHRLGKKAIICRNTLCYLTTYNIDRKIVLLLPFVEKQNYKTDKINKRYAPKQ